MRLIALVIVMFLLIFASADATTYHVAKATPDSVIQRALNLAQPGDSILVHTGHYREEVATVRAGTAAQRIVLAAWSDSVYISPSDDLNDAAFTKTPGRQHIWQLSGVTHSDLRQTKFPDFVIDDPNQSRFTMEDVDGPLALTRVPSLAVLDSVPGAYWADGSTLYVHALGGVQPGTTTTDLWANWSARPALLIQHSHIVVDGFRVYYASSNSGGVAVAAAAWFCELKDIYLASTSCVVSGAGTIIKNLSTCHAINRRQAPWQWFTDCEGSGLTLLGPAIEVRGGKAWHNWNGISSSGAHGLTVDGLVIHGCPNHAWLPAESKGLTLRNVVEFNCQDGLYFSSVEDILLENCTCFDGIYLQRYGSTPLGIGPVTVRSSILMGGTGFGMGVPADIEARITFAKCIVLRPPGARKPFQHGSSRYDLAEYLALPPPIATITGCVQVDSAFTRVLRGGAWQDNTDEWDVHVSGKNSPAFGTGLTLTSVLTDFEGQPRGATAYEIGADEHSNVPVPPGITLREFVLLVFGGASMIAIWAIIRRRRGMA